jgi:AcrR family transcriptional regulator
MKNRIIEVARTEFSTYGYSKISMSDLAIKLSISKKTFYQYFESKEALLLATVNQYINELKDEVAQIIKTETVFTDKAKKVLAHTGTKISSINPFFLEDIRENAPNVWQAIQQLKIDLIFKMGIELIDEGIKVGVLRKDINKTMVMMLYGSAVETILAQDFTRQIPQTMLKEMPFSSPAVFDGLIDIIFKGISKT